MANQADSIRVMLVEDHQVMLWGLHRLINGQDPRMKVIGTATTVDEALERLPQLTPDVILLDLDLGGSCSLEIFSKLLGNCGARVLVFTATQDDILLDRAISQGVRGVVHKTSGPDLLLKAIEKIHEGQLWLDNGTMARAVNKMIMPAVEKKLPADVLHRLSLTVKEREVIELIVAGSGAPNKVLAAQLFISESTFRNHLTSIYQKLNVGNRLELYIYAVKHQIAAPKS